MHYLANNMTKLSHDRADKKIYIQLHSLYTKPFCNWSSSCGWVGRSIRGRFELGTF